MFFKNAISRKVEFYKLRTIETANITLDTAFKVGLLILFIVTTIWISVFFYVAFYYTYVPSIEHVKNVNLQFTACEAEKDNVERGVCSFLRAHVELTKANQVFMLGQPYKITLFLEIPESDANKAVGMFMVCAQLLDKKSVTVSMSCRSAMLRYRSPLVHTLTTLALAPLYVTEVLEEKQTIEVELFSNFEDDQNYPVTDVVIEIKSQKVEIYSSKIQIDADLSGLRYIMFHWPVTSAIFGTAFNLTVILFISVLSYWQLYGTNEETGRELLYKKFKEKISPVFNPKKVHSLKEGIVLFVRSCVLSA
ncbi:unnamed protein product [Nezara viridula]|uniref:Seipin n=1 Tax=Nezara viridula TaxID=85310 RepID=A0A9P0H783_NEZVI|nr:unnamed protein product [Nezara viridula]